MYLNVNIVGGPSVKVSIVSAAELRAIQKEVRAKSIHVDGVLQEVIETGDQYLADIATEGDSELAQIASSGDQYLSDIATESDSELAQIAAAGDQEILDVQAAGASQVVIVDAEGDDQVARVRLVGDAQELIVTNEGDVQVARVIGYVDEAEDSKGWADAEARNADSWANAPVNTDVIQWTWDEITDVLVDTPRVGERSALHWQTIAQTVAAGLQFQATWDSVDCSLPITPTPPAGELANGYFYIVASVSGDTTGCSNLSIGDWLVWSGDLTGDTVVEGQWIVIDWTFDWSAITGVPENVSNALSRAGGVMTSPATVSYDASAPASAEYVARSYIDSLSALFMPINAALPFTAVPTVAVAQGTGVNELTRKDYVDTKLATTGGTMTGNLIFEAVGAITRGIQMNVAGGLANAIRAIDGALEIGSTFFSGQSFLGNWNFLGVVSGQAPTENQHLTRKDYVDAAISALNPVGSVVLRMDAIDPATIYGGTWSLMDSDATITFGDGTFRDGIAYGDNNPDVPLRQHNHDNTASFNGDALAEHTHTIETDIIAFSADNISGAYVEAGAPDPYITSGVSAGTPSGTVTMTNANAGTAGATLDVRGSRISINVWKRTA